MRRWWHALFFICAAGAAHGEEFTAKVIVVLDGDTVMVVRRCGTDGLDSAGVRLSPPCEDNKPFKIRLAEIDAPEKAQPGGMESKASLVALVMKKRVRVDVRAKDKYGRLVALLDVNGVNVNQEQVRRGMAWEYSSFHRNKDYIALQRQAQNARRGLWAQADPVPPWEWRKTHPSDAPAPADHAAGDYRCGNKRNCTQMRSCAEARFYFTRCGLHSLDGNGDGVPCESLCGKTK
jgi:endonuclease YncB( thermonuclease family)